MPKALPPLKRHRREEASPSCIAAAIQDVPRCHPDRWQRPSHCQIHAACRQHTIDDGHGGHDEILLHTHRVWQSPSCILAVVALMLARKKLSRMT